MPLNINLQQILLHALNFVILFGALYFLLYRPVKTYMDGRRAHYAKLDEDAKSALAAAEQTKETYAAQLKAADEEIARVRAQADEELHKEADERRAHLRQHVLLHILKAPRAASQIVDAQPGHRQHVRRKRPVARPEQRVRDGTGAQRGLRADERRGGKAGALEHLGRLRSVFEHGGGAQGP